MAVVHTGECRCLRVGVKGVEAPTRHSAPATAAPEWAMLRTASAARGFLARPWAGAAARRAATPGVARRGWRWCSTEAWSDGGDEEASEEEAVGPLNRDEEYMQLRALYIGQSMDVASLFRDCFHDSRHSLQRRNVVIHLDDVEEDSILEIRQWGGEAPEHKQRARQRFVVFHDYGCVVFFNVEEAAQRRLLDRVMPYVSHVNDVPNDGAGTAAARPGSGSAAQPPPPPFRALRHFPAPLLPQVVRVCGQLHDHAAARPQQRPHCLQRPRPSP